jgi:hypothetical protein
VKECGEARDETRLLMASFTAKSLLLKSYTNAIEQHPRDEALTLTLSCLVPFKTSLLKDLDVDLPLPAVAIPESSKLNSIACLSITDTLSGALLLNSVKEA